MICVEWDSGNRNSYGYEEDKKIFEVKIVNEPRLLLDDIIAVGCKVKRGNNRNNCCLNNKNFRYLFLIIMFLIK